MQVSNSLLLLAVLLVSSPSALPAQNVTAFKKGEQVTGMTKQCFYSFGATIYTQTIQSIQLCPLSISVAMAPSTTSGTATGAPASGQVTAFKKSEVITGLTKQCFYAFGSTIYTRTLNSIELCPLSISVKYP